MWSKTPRQTIFDTVSATPGPGTYNPKDARKTAGNVAFGKQGERFRREDSSLSTCSTSTNGSTTNRPPTFKQGRIQDRLRLFEVQIRERDQIISRLKMDKLAALSRYQALVDSYRQLRRISSQAIPSQRLPRDISQEILKILQEEKQNSKEETRPSMSDAEIKDKMSTFIVEMDQEDDPRIGNLGIEKKALQGQIEDLTRKISSLEEEKSSLNQSCQEATIQIGILNGNLKALEAKDCGVNDKLFATFTELGETKATLASLETTLAQQKSLHEELKRSHDETVSSLRNEMESKENTLREMKQSFNEMTAALRSSQEEREKLGMKANQTVDALEKALQEKETLELEGAELKNKCKKRKAELSELESKIREEHQKIEESKKRLTAAEEEKSELELKLEERIKSDSLQIESLKRQLAQSQENFERQLDEAKKYHDDLTSQKVEVEGELKVAVTRMNTLEKQVLTRDQLLEKLQMDNELSQTRLQECNQTCEELREQLSETNDEVTRLEGQMRLMQSDEVDARKEIENMSALNREMLRKTEEQLREIETYQSEIEALQAQNSSLSKALEQAVENEKIVSHKLRSLEKETSSMKLMNLATTAELEQTKTALELAKTDGPLVQELRSKVESLQMDNNRATNHIKELEEQMDNWVRVRNSLTEELKVAEAQLVKTQDMYSKEMLMHTNNIKVLERELEGTKKSYESEIDELHEKYQREKQAMKESSVEQLRELREKLDSTKKEQTILEAEADLLKTETESLINAKASLSLQLQAKESEILQIRNKAAEASFYSSKCLELDSQVTQLREIIPKIKEELQATREELHDVQENLQNEQKANEAHAIFSRYLISSGSTSERQESLQLENENLRQQLSNFTQLLDQLEHGIETSEAKNSVYVKSYAQLQQQIERLVGHSNSKQRIHYVGKLTNENRLLKEEQAKLRSKVDALSKKSAQLENQLRKMKDKENRIDQSAISNMSSLPRLF